MSGAVPRSDDLRLARLHLRGGAYALARVELETLAGSDLLDRAGILDLAEVRWRTGDLAGADAAAAAWLEDGEETGAEAALAHAISAEAAAGRGAPGEAAAHVEAAAGALGDRRAWEALLAGILPRAPWPWSVEEPALPEEPPSLVAPAAPGRGLPAGAEEGAPSAASAAGAADVAIPGALAAAAPPISPSAAQLVRAGAPLVAAAPGRAAILLALALRADRAAAEAVLAALDAAAPAPSAGAATPAGSAALSGPAGAWAGGEEPPAAATAGEEPSAEAVAGAESSPEAAAALAFVRAEALRAAGRHEEARIAYASAERLALAPAETGDPGSPQ